MSVLVSTNVAATFCVTVTLAGIGPKNGGEVFVSVITFTCSACVADLVFRVGRTHSHRHGAEEFWGRRQPQHRIL